MFKELMKRYMSEHSKVKKKSWLRDGISLDHLLPFFGNHIVSDVTPDLTGKCPASPVLQDGVKGHNMMKPPCRKAPPFRAGSFISKYKSLRLNGCAKRP
jgi:hypothetical protein